MAIETEILPKTSLIESCEEDEAPDYLIAAREKITQRSLEILSDDPEIRAKSAEQIAIRLLEIEQKLPPLETSN